LVLQFSLPRWPRWRRSFRQAGVVGGAVFANWGVVGGTVLPPLVGGHGGTVFATRRAFFIGDESCFLLASVVDGAVFAAERLRQIPAQGRSAVTNLGL